MITIRKELPKDVAAREALLDLSFGEARFAKTAERLRRSRLPAEGLAYTATAQGCLVGTARLWNVAAGAGRAALLLGPLAVHPDFRCLGIGTRMMRRALDDAARASHRAVLLVGDVAYYSRFGFSADKTGALWLPGAFDPARLLGRELAEGALDGALGMIKPTGKKQSVPAAANPTLARAA